MSFFFIMVVMKLGINYWKLPIWSLKKEEVTRNFRKTLMKPIYNEGGKSECEIYRGISLTLVGSKLLRRGDTGTLGYIQVYDRYLENALAKLLDFAICLNETDWLPPRFFADYSLDKLFGTKNFPNPLLLSEYPDS